jgi:RNA polymerase sigma-70 factor (ECF subfamily)
MGDKEELLKNLRTLDPQAITLIHAEFFPVVYRYAHYRTGNETVAEDIASETFIRLLEAIHAGGGPQTSLRGWLMGTASNLVNDYFRAVYNKPTESLHEGLPAQNGDPVSQSERATRQETLRETISKLTPEQQHILALRFGAGCSLAEAAEIMGKNINAIKQLQFRALSNLRKNIEGDI